MKYHGTGKYDFSTDGVKVNIAVDLHNLPTQTDDRVTRRLGNESHMNCPSA